MTEPMLIFETDPQVGTPRLQGVNGETTTWSPKDLRHLEEQLRTRYEGLVRAGEGTLDFQGQTLRVTRKEGDTSRQPTLEVRVAKPAPRRSSTGTTPSPKAPAGAPWTSGFLAEIDRLLGSAECESMLPAEKAMLQLVRNELREGMEKAGGPESALLMLVSLLRTAEHVCRSQEPEEPQPYTYALRGIERLLDPSERASKSPWGRLAVPPNPEPAPSWLGHFWKRVTRGG